MRYPCWMDLVKADRFTVLPEDTGIRLDLLLTRKFSNRSRTYLQSLIDQGAILRNGQKVKKGEIPLTGDEILVTWIDPPPMHLKPEKIPLQILYEDAHLLAVNKPSGMVVHPAPGHSSGTFVHALLAHCEGSLTVTDPIRPGIVHRLDKETSGVLLAAKTTVAHQKLVELFAMRQMEKEYLAVAVGAPPTGLLSAPIGRHATRRKEMAVQEEGKEAVSDIRRLAVTRELGLLLIRPKTGRTHQIRVHLKHLGHPVLGDEVYGSQKTNRMLSAPRLMLHAYRLTFLHPLTKESLQIVAPLPEDFKQFLLKSFSSIALE